MELLKHDILAVKSCLNTGNKYEDVNAAFGRISKALEEAQKMPNNTESQKLLCVPSKCKNSWDGFTEGNCTHCKSCVRSLYIHDYFEMKS